MGTVYFKYLRFLFLLLALACQTERKNSELAVDVSLQQKPEGLTLSREEDQVRGNKNNNEKIYLLKNKEKKINAQNLIVTNLAVVKKKQGKFVVGSVDFDISPEAQLAQYVICPHDKTPSHRTLADCQVHIANLIPLELFDLSPGAYDVKVRACVSSEIAKEEQFSCGEYQITEFVQEKNSDEILQAYKIMELAMLDSLSEWAGLIKQNVLRYKLISQTEPACLDLPDHAEIIYAAELLQIGMIVAGLHHFVNTEIPFIKYSQGSRLALKNHKVQEDLLKKIKYREAFSFQVDTVSSSVARNDDPDTLQNIISQRIHNSGYPKTMSLTPGFLWQMTQSILSVYEVEVDECKARKDYNAIANEIESKLIGLKSNLASIRGRRETNLSTIGEQHEKN